MHMQHVARGKDAGQVRFQALIDRRAAGDGVQRHARGAAQLVFGQQPAGKQQRVAVVVFLGAGDGFSVFDPRQRDAGHALLALNVHYRVAQFQRNVKIIEALHNIAL